MVTAVGHRQAGILDGHPRWQPARGARGGTAPEVVVTDALLRQSLVLIRSLGRRGLAVGAVECAPSRLVPAFASRYLAAAAGVPDRSAPDALVESLLGLADNCATRPVLVPTHDGTIAAIEARRPELEQRYAIALARSDALEAANDKATTFEAASRLGIRTPRAALVTDVSQTRAAVAEIGLPAVLKPVRSWVGSGGAHHRLGVRGVTSVSAAEQELRTMLAAGATVLLQEWVTGARVAVSFVRVEGVLHGEFAQVAHRMLPVVGGDSVLRESIAVPEEEGKAARSLVEELDLDGYAEVEFRRDAHGDPVLMEVNPRVSASVELAVRAGVDMPGLILAWARGDDPGTPVPGYRIGARMRWLGADVKWLLDNRRLRGQPDTVPNRHACAHFCSDFLRRTGYDYFTAGDLGPAAVAVAADARWVAHEVTGRLNRKEPA